MTNRFLSHKGNFRDAKHHRSWKVTCCMCNASKIVDSPRSGTKEPQEYVLKEFERGGWFIASHSSSDCCPRHTPARETYGKSTTPSPKPAPEPPQPKHEPITEPPQPKHEPITLKMEANFLDIGVTIRYHDYGSVRHKFEDMIELLGQAVHQLRQEMAALSSSHAELMNMLTTRPQAIPPQAKAKQPVGPSSPPINSKDNTEELNRRMIERLRSQLGNGKRAG
jgi:hypothetical protein